MIRAVRKRGKSHKTPCGLDSTRPKADSLAFSASSAKTTPQLADQETLQLRLEDWETKTRPTIVHEPRATSKRSKGLSRQCTDSSSCPSRQALAPAEGRANSQLQAGSIVHRGDMKRKKPQGRRGLAKGESEISRLRKEAEAARSSLQRSERSRSQCSERLSASQSLIRTMREEEREQRMLVGRLRGQLRRSEAIRAQQKQVIAAQQRELGQCRQQLRRAH